MRSPHRARFVKMRFIASSVFMPLFLNNAFSVFMLVVLDVVPLGLMFRNRTATDDINVVPTKILPLRGIGVSFIATNNVIKHQSR